jgi:hypothetical protein
MVENDIDVGFIIKKAVKSIVHDPGYILLYLLPILVYIIAMIHMWLIVDVDPMAVSQNIQNQSEFLNILIEKSPSIVAMGIVYGIVSLIVGTVAIAGLIKKAEVQETREKLGVSDALSFGLRVFPRLFAAMIIGILVIAGPIFAVLALLFFSVIYNIAALVCLSSLLMLILVIPILYIGIRLSLYALACVIDDLGPIDCLKRSWQVSKGNVILIFVTMLILGIICIAIAIPFTILGYSGVPYISSIGNIIAVAFFGPLYGITLTLLYLKISGKQKRTGMMESNLTDLSNDSFSSRA